MSAEYSVEIASSEKWISSVMPKARSLNRLPVRLGRARHRKRDVLDPVAVSARETRDIAVGAQPAREDEPDVVLVENVRRAIPHTGLGAGIRRLREPERVLVEVGGLF